MTMEGVAERIAWPEETEAAARPRRRWLPFSPWHLVLFPLAMIMLLPLLWMIVTSLETQAETLRFPPVLVPSSLQFGNYPNALRSAPFGRWFLNSFIYTGTVVVSNLLLCSLAGYAFARIKFVGREPVFILCLATLMVPFQVVMIPTFLIVKKLGLFDSLPALIAPNLVSAFGIFMLRQFFRTLPIELEEAARIDGASRLGVLFKIVLPLSLPALATLAVIQFMWTWNDFLWPLIATFSQENFTLQLGLTVFQVSHNTFWPLVMAGNVMSMIPMLAMFFAAQRYFVRGIATTGLKG
jgi:multiple sugar transport system permease protein